MSVIKDVPHIYLDNRIFGELSKHIENSKHLAFAYSYIYYITYLYRYCKHTASNVQITQEAIKKTLGYSPKNKTVDYIIKKGGLLDTIQYTLTTTDYPLEYGFDENRLLYFNTVSSFKEEFNLSNSRNYKVK